jgi:hypothetical protein
MKRKQRSFGESDFGCFLLREKQAASGVWRRFGKTRFARAVIAENSSFRKRFWPDPMPKPVT